MPHKMGRHPARPGHIHINVSAPGHLPVTTHLFVAGSPYLDSDALLGMKESLVDQFDRHPAGARPQWRAHGYAVLHSELRLPL